MYAMRDSGLIVHSAARASPATNNRPAPVKYFEADHKAGLQIINIGEDYAAPQA